MNRRSSRRSASTAYLVTALGAAVAIGCDPGASTGRKSSAGGSPQTGLPTTSMAIGSKTFTLEIAATDEQRNIGLMHRDSMPADHGMIFVFRNARPLAFWMRNTRIPLDILYVDAEGKIVSVHQMQPLDLTGVPSKGPAKYAIELNQGMANAVGVKEGDRLRIPDDVLATKADASLPP